MRRERNDVHAPKNLITEDYQYVGISAWMFPDRTEKMIAPLKAEGWEWAEADHAGDHQCWHCGAHIKYFAILKHVPSHSLVLVGETCLDNRFDLAPGEFQKLRKRAKYERERQSRTDDRDEWKNAHPEEVQFLRDYYADHEAGGKYSEFFSSLCESLIKYGRLTDRQVEALRMAMGRWQGQPELAVECPEGEETVTGVILSVKKKEERDVMTVKDDRGFRVWGTVPNDFNYHVAELRENIKGTRVRFVANLKPSSNDPQFGFYHNAREAVVL